MASLAPFSVFSAFTGTLEVIRSKVLGDHLVAEFLCDFQRHIELRNLCGATKCAASSVGIVQSWPEAEFQVPREQRAPKVPSVAMLGGCLRVAGAIGLPGIPDSVQALCRDVTTYALKS